MTPLPPPGAPARVHSQRRRRPSAAKLQRQQLQALAALLAVAVALAACGSVPGAHAAAAGTGTGAGGGANLAAPERHLAHRPPARLRPRADPAAAAASGGDRDPLAAAAAAAAAASTDGGELTDATTTMPPAPGGCSSCMMREGLRNLSLNAIKEQILNKLGMKHAPNMTGRHFPKIPRIHQHLLDMYRIGGSGGGGGQHGMQGDEPAAAASSVFKTGPVVQDEEDDFHARMEKVIAFAQPASALPYGTPKIRHNHKLDIQYFRFSEKITRNRVERAFLWVYVKGLNWTSEKEGRVIVGSAETSEEGGRGGPHLPLNITLWRVGTAATATATHDLPKVQVLADTKKHHRHTGRGDWLRLDVHKLLAEWFRHPTDSLALLVQVSDESGHQLVVTDPNEDDGMLIPYIEVTTTDKRKHRTKRTIGLNCDESSDETRCCRYPLTVDFEEFGWDWIIAPKKYEANYCSGECPYVFLQKYPHTHIVHLAHPTGTVGPCCAPRKMSAISMLYFDNEFNIIYGLLPGMVVDRCGCS